MERDAINALSGINSSFNEMSFFLIENADVTIVIEKQAATFISLEHDYRKITEKYLAVRKS